MSDGDPKPEKERLWKVDPETFKPGRPRRLRETLKDLAKSIGKAAGFTLLVAYPVLLTILGIEFGGLVFWGTLAGSLAAIGLVLKRLGYARRFESQNPKLLKQLVALSLAFAGIAFFLFVSLWLTRGLLP